MAQALAHAAGPANVLPVFPTTGTVTEELTRILALLRQSCPPEAVISFDFDGELHVHIDVRKKEDVTLVQAMLPMLGMGLFDCIRLGSTPHRPFFHRISALVAR